MLSPRISSSSSSSGSALVLAPTVTAAAARHLMRDRCREARVGEEGRRGYTAGDADAISSFSALCFSREARKLDTSLVAAGRARINPDHVTWPVTNTALPLARWHHVFTKLAKQLSLSFLNYTAHKNTILLVSWFKSIHIMLFYK